MNFVSRESQCFPRRRDEFCFPEILIVEVEGKQNSLFSAEPVIKCFAIPPNSKVEKKKKKKKKLGKIVCLTPT